MVATRLLTFVTLLAATLCSAAQAPRDIVRQAVQTELTASRDDHSHWLYFEIDRQPSKTVKQWVAETRSGSLDRVIERNGQTLSENEQRQETNGFINDPRAQAKQHKSGQHDDEQAAELLKILPDAFIWTRYRRKGERYPASLQAESAIPTARFRGSRFRSHGRGHDNRPRSASHR